MEQIYQVLQQFFGYSTFREGQEALINAQLDRRDALGVMPTGGGKSLCYQIPAILLDGISIVISPLISLMQDQVLALQTAGVPAAYLNSSLSAMELEITCQNLAEGRYKLLYVAPERLLNESFLSVIRQVDISLVVVDEAHCISQWGQDFRPSYLRIVDFLQQLPHRPVVSAFTATATQQVREDIERQLGLQNPLRIVTGFDRPNLHFSVLKPSSKPAVLRTLIEERQDKCGIVYCATRKEVEQVCAALQAHGISATRYHAGLSEEERSENQSDFINDRRTVMVATNAFGMGIDKSNVSYVIHYNMPQSMEAYYQEAGRAGRDGSAADCILLFAPRDIVTAKFLILHPDRQAERTEEQERRIQLELSRLEQMIGYCRTARCLRGYILDYFDQSHPERCNNCGNCEGETLLADVTTEAKMILSCIHRIRSKLGYSVGPALVTAVLRGSKNQRVRSLELDTLSTYGLLANAARDQVRDILDHLESQGYVRVDPSHGAVSLTNRASAVLLHDEIVQMPVKQGFAPRTDRRKSAKKQANQQIRPKDDALFAALKALRFRLAKEENVPAYIVFTNASLEDMAAKMPETMEEFFQVSGVGQRKAARYGEAFLAEIRAFREREAAGESTTI